MTKRKRAIKAETKQSLRKQPSIESLLVTPRIYADHVAAYAGCCCPSGPADYWAWVGVTTVPIPVCDLVGLTIRWFGSCHGTPGAW